MVISTSLEKKNALIITRWLVFHWAKVIIDSAQQKLKSRIEHFILHSQCHQAISQLPNSFMGIMPHLSRVCNFIDSLISWVHSFSESYLSDMYQVNQKKIPPTTFVDITAMHGNFYTKFYTIVKRSNIHFITKFYWNISGIDKATQF